MNATELHRTVQLLSTADKKLQQAILKAGHDDLIKFIGEIALNLLQEVIPLTPYFKSKLTDYAWFIRLLGSKRIKARKRRQLCVRHSHLVGLLLRATSPDWRKRLGGNT